MSSRAYRFGSFVLDPAARELRRDGVRVATSQKVFDCLVWLIAHRERAVGRDELIAAVWGRVDVSDTHLGKTMFQVRRAIGDNGDEQGMILTVPRFGYRWIAPTLDLDVAAAPASVSDRSAFIEQGGDRISGRLGVAASEVSSKRTANAGASATLDIAARPAHQRSVAPARSRLRWIGFGAVVLLIALAAGLLHRAAIVAPAPSASAPVASSTGAATILPAFVEAEASSTWLRLGMMELVAQRLRAGGINVVPNDTVMAAARGAAAAGKDEAASIPSLIGTDGPVLVPRLRHDAAGWSARLEWRVRGAPAQTVEAQAADAISATQAAVDRLLAVLGQPPQQDTAASKLIGTPDASTLRVEAALLDDDAVVARRELEALPEIARAAPRARLLLARIELKEGALDQALRHLDALAAETREETDPLLRADVLLARGHAALFDPADTSSAVSVFGDALRLLEGRGSASALAVAYAWRGIALTRSGRYDDARADFASARVALQTIGDTLGLARVDANEGIMDVALGRGVAALGLLERAGETFERYARPVDLAQVLNAEVTAELSALRPDRAMRAAERLREQLPRLPGALTRSLGEGTLAGALVANGRWREATEAYERAETDAEQAGERRWQGELAGERARLAFAQGRPDAAYAGAERAVDALTSADSLRARAIAWLFAARSLRSLGRDGEAAASVARFADWAHAAEDSTVAAYAELALAEQAWAGRNRSAAVGHYEAALRGVTRSGVAADLREVANSYGYVLLADGETAKAAAVIGQLARWAEYDYTCALAQAALYRALGQPEPWRNALQRARELAGERPIPAALAAMPATAAR